MFKKDNNAGLYLTIAFHLLLLIILLASRIDYLLKEESSFILDFTNQEYIEEIARQERLKEDISREIDELLSSTNQGSAPVRNVITDRSAQRGEQLRDDRFNNPTQVYDEHRSLQERLDAARREAEAHIGSDDDVAPVQQKQESSTESYKGPSVISYSLENRKAMSLPIPVYKCIAGGDVAVAIVVDNRGYVRNATVIPHRSSTDICLQEYATRAAMRSRFTASTKAPSRQTGEIIYRFIAQ